MATDDVLSAFQKLYIEYVNDDDMYNNYISFRRYGEGVDDTEAAMKRFIVNTPQFEKRVTTIMDRVLPALAVDRPADADLKRLRERCLSVFRSDAEFSISRLTDVLRDELDAAPEDYPTEQDTPRDPEDPPVTAISAETFSDGAVGFIAKYESASARPMYAYELVALHELHGDALWDSDVESLAARVATAYDVVCDMVMRFEGHHMSEREFAARWLAQIMQTPSEDVREHLTRELMDGENYRVGMRARIVKKHASLLGCAPSDDDVDYVFAIAAARRMHLLDDAMDELLTDAWEEKQNDSREIFDVYVDTYGREPDQDEVALRVAEFRAASVFGSRDEQHLSELRERLRRRLCEDLEYRDVVKSMISAHYQSAHGSKIPARVLYDALKVVLDEVPHLYDTDCIHAAIARVV